MTRRGCNASTELIPAGARAEVADIMSQYTLAEIGRMFEPEGFTLPADFELPQSSMRRGLIAGYESLIDFASVDDAEAYLRVLERLLDQLADTGTPWAGTARERLLRVLLRAEIRLDDHGRLRASRHPLTSSSLAAAPSESGIRLAMTRLERFDAEAEEKVGAAKELVEATIKHALLDLGEPVDPAGDVPALAKQLHKRLRLDPRSIAPTARGAETMVRLLAGLTQIPQGLAELRNEGYGTGHGQATRLSGIKPRHADLASRAAVAYASFILDTLADPDAPWRS